MPSKSVDPAFSSRIGSGLLGLTTVIVRALLSALYPRRCMVCGMQESLLDAGPVVSGLRGWDVPPLCEPCRRAHLRPAVQSRAPDCGIEFFSGCRTSAAVLDMIAAWKYHGIRGLGWPLAQLAVDGLEEAIREAGPVEALIPIPLHGRRRRSRGFNQSEMLAYLLDCGRQLPVLAKVLVRTRATSQQASLDSAGEERLSNVSDAFAACRADRDAPCIGLVDDVITSGATIQAAAAALGAAGWSVKWAVSICLADRST